MLRMLLTVILLTVQLTHVLPRCSCAFPAQVRLLHNALGMSAKAGVPKLMWTRQEWLVACTHLQTQRCMICRGACRWEGTYRLCNKGNMAWLEVNSVGSEHIRAAGRLL